MGFGVRKNPPAPGFEVILPGNKVIVPELSNGQRKANGELLKRWDALDRTAPGWFDIWVALSEETIFIALERNYPDIKPEDLDDFARSDVLSGANYALNGEFSRPLFPKPGESPAVPTSANGTAAAPVPMAPAVATS